MEGREKAREIRSGCWIGFVAASWMFVYAFRLQVFVLDLVVLGHQTSWYLAIHVKGK